jgi:hypothetical protein
MRALVLATTLTLVACGSESSKTKASGTDGGSGASARGGSSSGGSSSGGSSSGGSSSGGSSSGGSSSGGSSSGSGGQGSGGTSGSSGQGSGGVPRDAGPGDCPTRPALEPGVWKNITPPAIDLPDAPPPYGLAWVEIDPSDPCTLYVTSDEAGAWKTTDGGTSWTKLGLLDSPIAIKIDPDDPMHLYATQGVRGETLGFWVSHDGGETWEHPPGYAELTRRTTNDLTSIAVDPTDFKHVLLGSHSPWDGLENAGIIETKDGGETFIIHDPVPEFNAGSMGVNFLYDPAHGVGDSNTWLIGTDGEGLWRTSDGGENFTRVTPAGVWPDFSIAHGGQQLYYASSGAVYVGGFVYPSRSLDNGLTWESLDMLPYATYYSVVGDGKQLYTQVSFTGDNGREPEPYYVSPESDGLTWSEYDPHGTGPQTFIDGPFVMRFDGANGILYSANWDAGLWALKVME